MAVTVSQCSSPSAIPTPRFVFYRDAPGLEARNDVASDGFRWGHRRRRGLAGARVPAVVVRDCAFRDPSGNLVRIAQA